MRSASTIVMRSTVRQTTSSAYVPRPLSSSLMLTVSCCLMRLIIMWNGRNGSQLLVLSEGGSNIVNLLKIFYFQPPLRIVFFRAKRLLCEKNAFLGRVGKYLSIRQLLFFRLLAVYLSRSGLRPDYSCVPYLTTVRYHTLGGWVGFIQLKCR